MPSPPGSIVQAVLEKTAAQPARSTRECAICLDGLSQPQTMPCGHQFCRGCVDGMRTHGVVEVCPLCRGPMPDDENIHLDVSRKLVQFEQYLARNPITVPRVKTEHPHWIQVLLAEVATLCRQSLAIDGTRARAHFALGKALKYSNDVDGAAAAFREGIANDPEPQLSADMHVYLGSVLNDRHDLDGAETAYQSALTLCGDEGDKLALIARSNLCAIAVERGHFASAVHDLEAILQIDPDLSHAKSILLGLLDYEAKCTLRPVYEWHNAHPDAPLDEALRDALHQGTALCLRALAVDDSAADFRQLLTFAFALEGEDELAHMRRAVEENAQIPWLHYILGATLERRGDEDGAEAAYRAGITAGPKGYVDLHLNLSCLLSTRDDVDGAEAVLRAAIAAVPTAASAHFNLACLLHFERRDLVGSEAAFRAVLANEPLHSGALNSMGTIFAMRGDFSSAISMYSAVLQIDPHDKNALTNLKQARKDAAAPPLWVESHQNAESIDGAFVKRRTVSVGWAPAVGDRVVLHGLQSQADLNGRGAVVTGEPTEAGRLPIELDVEPADSGGRRTVARRLSVKLSNVRVAD